MRRGIMRALSILAVFISLLVFAGCGNGGSGGAPAAPPTIYVGTSDGFVIALNPGDGSVRWRTQVASKTEAPKIIPDVNELVLDQNVLYAGSGPYVAALNASDGSVRWRSPALGQSAAGGINAATIMNLQVVQNTIYVQPLGSPPFVVLALNAGDGSVRWRFTEGGEVDNDLLGADQLGAYVYTHGADIALNASDGSVRWQNQNIYYRGLAGDTLYSVPVEQGNNPTTLIALNTNDGKERWRFDAQGGQLTHPVIVDGVVYLGEQDSGTGQSILHALNASDGSQHWQFEGANVFEEPLVQQGVVYLSTGSSVVALNASDGSQRWDHQTGDLAPDLLVLGDGALYFFSFITSTNEGVFTALNVSDGSQRWQFQRQDMRTANLSLEFDGVFVIPDLDHRQFSGFDASDGKLRWQAAAPDLTIIITG